MRLDDFEREKLKEKLAENNIYYRYEQEKNCLNNLPQQREAEIKILTVTLKI